MNHGHFDDDYEGESRVSSEDRRVPQAQLLTLSHPLLLQMRSPTSSTSRRCRVVLVPPSHPARPMHAPVPPNKQQAADLPTRHDLPLGLRMSRVEAAVVVEEVVVVAGCLSS